jgi:hypothetical protein
VELQDEETWLRFRILRMRAALRFALSPAVQNILRELVADGEARLQRLESSTG